MSAERHLVLQEHIVPPGTEWPLQFRAWAFLSVQTGDAYLFPAAPAQPVSPGDLLVITGATNRQLRASQIGPVRVRLVQVEPALLTGVLSPLERHRLDRGGAASAAPRVRLFPAGHQMAKRMAHICQDANGRDDVLTRCRFLELIATLFMEELPPAEHQPQGLTAAERLDALMSQLSQSTLQHSCVADLASACGCSARHFSRLFRKQFGCSFGPKQIELRLQKAQELLRHTDAKIIDVALDSGFQHVGLFTATFKKQFGVTPSAWRKRRRRVVNPGR